MAYEVGRLQNIMIGTEAVAWGTKAAAMVGLPVLAFDPNPQQSYAKNNSRLGRIERNYDSAITRQWSEPSLSCIVNDTQIGYIMKAILGTNATTGPTDTSVYTHALSVKNDNTPVSLTLLYKDGNKVKMITGAVVNTAKISLVQEDYVKIDLTFVGKFPVVTTETVSYVASNKFTGEHVGIKFAVNLAGLAAASVIAFESASIEFNKNAVPLWKLGDEEPYKTVNTVFDVTGEFSIVHNDMTYFDLFEAGTKKAIRIALTSNVTIGAASNPSLTIDLAQANLENWAEPDSLDDIKMETFGFSAEYLAGTSMITASLVNTTVSYP